MMRTFHGFHRLGALFCALGLLTVSATSCNFLEMRDATSVLSAREETVAPTLQQAERKSEVEKKDDSAAAQQSGANGTAAVTEEPFATVSLAISGGIAADDNIRADAASRAREGKEYSFLTLYSGVYPFIQNADFAMTTLQGPVVEADPVDNEIPVEALPALHELGFDLINVAGQYPLTNEGLSSTMAAVNAEGLTTIGAYSDSIDANDIRLYEKDGVTIAFLSFVETAPGGETPVVPDLSDMTAVEATVTYADLISDVVVVSVTWDADNNNRRPIAMQLAEAGADVIVGNGTKLEKAEWLDTEDGTKTFVAYSLGNLLSDGDTRSGILSGILTMDIVASADGSISLSDTAVHPIVTHYTDTGVGYQAMDVAQYANELAAVHMVKGLTRTSLREEVGKVISSDFLPADITE